MSSHTISIQDEETSFGGRLQSLHDTIIERLPGISRIAVALYDSETDLLKTFINSTRQGLAIAGYEYPLAQSESLSQLKRESACRVVDDISKDIFPGNEHSDWLLEQNYGSSFTIPLSAGERFYGFVFIDAAEKYYFSDQVQRDLLLFSNMIMLTISSEMSAVHSLLATAQAARDFADLRDFETGMHLNRMARFARLIAKAVAQKWQITDEKIEHIYLFAPLHDIGKIGIPDRILLKPGRLDADEHAMMQEHVNLGVRLLQKVLDDYKVAYLNDSKVMLNIVAYHHEFLDGTGYPNGLSGEQIPIEARIITVADIFDALTSTRPYKKAWSIEDALNELDHMASKGKLDSDCVQALRDNSEEVLEIVTRMRDPSGTEEHLSAGQSGFALSS